VKQGRGRAWRVALSALMGRDGTVGRSGNMCLTKQFLMVKTGAYPMISHGYPICNHEEW